MELKLTFDDVALVPQYNNIKSRTEPCLDTWLTKNRKVKMPLIPANMDTVICDNLADVIVENGGIPIFHRFTSIDQQVTWAQKYKDNCFVSCGFNDTDKLDKLFENGACGVCIDVAHGHSLQMINLIRELKSKYPDKDIIAGNICTAVGYQDLVNAGADAVKVGVGPGSACSTRKVTGFGVPQFSAIKDIATLAKKLQVPIIADGGIRDSRDVTLALAAGASTCMIGGLFSKTYESAGKKYLKYLDQKIEVGVGKKISVEYGENQYSFLLGRDRLPFDYKIISHYRGQASKDFQEDYYGKLKKGTVPEGIDFEVECKGSTEDLLNNLLGGLRSGLTYGGGKSIKELQRKAEFVRVSGNYMSESNPRPW